MPTVQDVLAALQTIAPAEFALPGDKVGHQVGDAGRPVTRAVVSLDRSIGAVEYAARSKAELLLSHHPLIYAPLEAATAGSHVGKTVMALVEAGMSFIAAHTNWDAAEGGINDRLASMFGLTEVRPFGMSALGERLVVTVHCPPKALEVIVDAASRAGAGAIGLYRRCAFEARGMGTFEPLEGARPAVGSVGHRESVEEAMLQMQLPVSAMDSVRSAVIAAHPYEEPAYSFSELAAEPLMPLGRVGSLPSETHLGGLAVEVAAQLGGAVTVWGDPDIRIRRLAVVGGAADDEWRAAKLAGANALLTGEVRQHEALEAAESGFALIAGGHYATEHPGCIALAERMRSAIPSVEWLVYEPAPGMSGRPFYAAP